jgi:hypothetical protein
MKLNQILIESSLSRIWQHINDPDRKFAIISAYLDKNDDVLNHEKLKKDIRKTGHGFIEMKSGYSYVSNNKEVAVDEKSYLIPNISKRDAITLGMEYGQESILWKDSKEFILLGVRKDVGVGKVLMKFSTKNNTMTFDTSTVKAAFSALAKGSKNHAKRKFAFVSERRIMDFPTSYIYQNKSNDEWLRII